MADLTQIKHVVVLMLENRSFDNVFGFLRAAGPDFDGLMGLPPKQNPVPGAAPVETWVTTNPTAGKTIPNPDPGEMFTDITQQLFNGGSTEQAPSMTGFASNYVSAGGKPGDIMHCYAPSDLPAMTQLAQSFAISDRWFASAPCQTWPNRFFVHAATAGGYENNDAEHAPFSMQTVFNELDGVVPWKIYFHDFPQAALLSRLWPRFSNFRFFSEFLKDAAAGTLPGYAFIEPMYYPTLDEMPNDMHPPHDVGYGDALVARVYNAVRSSPNWPSTLMIVVFDEHGGCYDHVPPPSATPPEIPRPDQTFAFDRFGVRIPALVISAYTTPTVLRSNGTQPFDHTSIIKTVRQCFGIDGSLTARDAAAPDLSGALNAEFDMNRGPASVPESVPACDANAMAATRSTPLNSMQALLHAFAQQLHPIATAASTDDHLTNVMASGTATPAATPPGTPASTAAAAPPSAEDAGAYVRRVMQDVLARYGSTQSAPPMQNNAGTLYRGH